jgi:hypothetical protein
MCGNNDNNNNNNNNLPSALMTGEDEFVRETKRNLPCRKKPVHKLSIFVYVTFFLFSCNNPHYHYHYQHNYHHQTTLFGVVIEKSRYKKKNS